jgi:hypothetical protein
MEGVFRTLKGKHRSPQAIRQGSWCARSSSALPSRTPKDYHPPPCSCCEPAYTCARCSERGWPVRFCSRSWQDARHQLGSCRGFWSSVHRGTMLRETVNIDALCCVGRHLPRKAFQPCIGSRLPCRCEGIMCLGSWEGRQPS